MRLDAGELVELDDREAGLFLLQGDGESVPGDADVAGADAGDAVADVVDIAEVARLLRVESVPQAKLLQMLPGELADGGHFRIGEADLAVL